MKKKPSPDKIKSAKKFKILIVDDEKYIIDLVKIMMENMGVEVRIKTAANGMEAGYRLAHFLPQLVILDAIMPGANGDVVCNMIRKNKALKGTKILVFTGYPSEGDKLFKLGADKVIIKGSKDSRVDKFKKEVCRLLGIKYRKVVR